MGLGNVISTLGNIPTLLALKRGLKPRPGNEQDSMAKRLQHNAQRFPERPALLFEGASVTWRALNERSNRYARALEIQGVGKGDTVSVFMENRLEFLTVVFALNKIGAVGALINTHLTGRPLAHCISVTESKKCIVGAEVCTAIGDSLSELALAEGSDFLYVADPAAAISCPNWAVDLDAQALSQSADNAAADGTHTLSHKALYIFTSGTTGLPKAAILSNRRYLMSGHLAHVAGLRCTEEDRLYICLPLYHGTGLMVGIGAALQSGASVFIRRRFSASNFLREVRENQCTCLIYIGELCRYLCNTPAQADDADNPLTAAMGNGLRPDIWMTFKERFGIHRITEFYGASEGNVSFANVLNRNQTIGLTGNTIALVKYDVDAEEIVRDDRGQVIEVTSGEPGLLLAEINDTARFEGYTDERATEAKIVRNLRQQGDAWFNTGDLIREVSVGFALGYAHYQFVDRLGDTYRWKSENVSTNEVGEIINRYPQVQLSNVYGVEVPNTDGRAGMVAVALAEGHSELDIEAFSAYVRRELPSYAIPVFLRVQLQIDVTATFKMVKGELRKSGYDPALVRDPLYVMLPGEPCYQPLTADILTDIRSGTAGF